MKYQITVAIKWITYILKLLKLGMYCSTTAICAMSAADLAVELP
jgi:predicted glycoside hydrolase/deacetylase ChbG (UPF0249 family)